MNAKAELSLYAYSRVASLLLQHMAQYSHHH